MKATLPARYITLSLFLFCICLKANAQEISAIATPPSKIIVPLNDTYARSLSEFGTRIGDNIRVAIFGQVKQPGIYYLPLGTVVHDAIQSAGGLTEFATFRLSSIVRPISAEQGEKIKFSRRTESSDMKIPLKEGDRLFLTELFD